MKPDLFWIPGPWAGKLAIAGRPRGGDWLDDELQGWSRAGVQVVVSLLEDFEAEDLGLAEEASAAASAGLRFIRFPIPDRGTPASTSEALSVLTQLAFALAEGKTVVVHCRQGIGRSGLISAGLLVTSGWDPAQAIQAISAARGITVPETAEQMNWIQQLPSEQLISAS